MHAMALASPTNSLLGSSHPLSLSVHSSPRQAWRRNGGVLVSVSAAASEHSSGALDPDGADEASVSTSTSRRQLVTFLVASICACLATTLTDKGVAIESQFADMPALRGKDYGKTKMKYPDYVETESGLQYKDLRPGSGPAPSAGNMVVGGKWRTSSTSSVFL